MSCVPSERIATGAGGGGAPRSQRVLALEIHEEACPPDEDLVAVREEVSARHTHEHATLRAEIGEDMDLGLLLDGGVVARHQGSPPSTPPSNICTTRKADEPFMTRQSCAMRSGTSP